MRGSMSKQAFHLFRIVRRPHVPRTRYRCQVFIRSKQQFAAGTSIVLLYEKGDAVRIEPRPPSPNACRAASPRAARGRCFDPKRAATAPGCRACSASPEHRAGSLLIVGQDQTLRLTAAAVREARRQLLTMAHASTASSAPMPYREVLAEGRASVGLYATASVGARST